MVLYFTPTPIAQNFDFVQLYLFKKIIETIYISILYPIFKKMSIYIFNFI